jgi:hypothetical protein
VWFGVKTKVAERLWQASANDVSKRVSADGCREEDREDVVICLRELRRFNCFFASLLWIEGFR